MDQDVSDISEIYVSYSGGAILDVHGNSLIEQENILIRNNVPKHFGLIGRLEAEDYEINNGFVVESTNDIDGDYNLGYLDAGDYAIYPIRVAETGNYFVALRVASNSSIGYLELQQLDLDSLVLHKELVQVPSTGDWATWETIYTNMNFDEGRGALLIKVVTSGFNLNWLDFSQVTLGMPVINSPIFIYPNPTSSALNIVIDQNTVKLPTYCTIYNSKGKKVFKSEIENRKAVLDIRNLKSGVYLVRINYADQSVINERLIVK